MPSVVSCDADPDHQAEGEAAELTSGLPNSDLRGGLMVEVQRLRIVGERRDEDVVGLGDGARDRVRRRGRRPATRRNNARPWLLS